MANNLILQGRLSVGTVDSFQGQERNIIAITLTRSNPQAEIGFLSDIRRLNVGMTLARRMRWPKLVPACVLFVI
jgi:ATP-dependent RNA/DNA helicase IGHMBP2